MKKMIFCIVFLFPITTFGAVPIDTFIVNLHRFELSGLMSFDSYASNYHVTSSIEFGANWLGFMNSALNIDGEYRNYSVKSIGTLSTSFRFFLGRHEIRPGICGGLSVLTVGNYSDNSPLIGLQGLYVYNVRPSISLRAQLNARWFFEDHTVFGSKVLLGVCWSFCK
jgi:hypothetical protein